MRVLFIFLLSLSVTACTTNPHKAEDLETEMDSTADVVAGEKVGIKDGKMVIQKKTLLAEELRRLQYYVYELEDRVYGNRKFGSKGLYGVLKQCRIKLSSRQYGGDGKLKWIEPLKRVTDKESELTIGLDEEKKLVAISEEYIKDRIERFQGYKKVLHDRQDEYEEKIEICEAELRSRVADLKDF